MTPAERLEALERALDHLRDACDECVALVEGTRDVAALRTLGIEGDIRIVHQGQRLVEFVDGLAGERRRIILMTDWDRTGGRLHRTLLTLLQARGVRFDDTHRKTLAQLSGATAKSVEALPGLVRSLQDRVRGAHLGKSHRG